MSTRLNQIVDGLSWASCAFPVLALALAWAGLTFVSPALGQMEDGSGSRTPEADAYVIRVSFSPGFGQESADAVCAILKREVSFWQQEPQGSEAQGDRRPRSDPGSGMHINVLCIAVAIVLWAILIAILGLGVGWVADTRRIPKYNALDGSVRLSWRLGQCVIVATCALVVWPLMVGVLTRQPGVPVTGPVQEPPGPSVPPGPLAVRIDGPHESQESLAASVLTCLRQEPDTTRLGHHIVSTLDIYGLGEIKVVSRAQGAADAPEAKRHLVLHLHTQPHLELKVHREPDTRVDSALADLHEKIPHLKISPSDGTEKAQQCTLHYAKSNPLGRILAAQTSEVLAEHGLTPEVIDASALLEPQIIVLVIPTLPETRLVLHHLLIQDVAVLTTRLRQEGVAVVDRPSDSPPAVPGILYYPIGDRVGTALAAREKADRILQLAHDQGFLGDHPRTGWGIPAGREGIDTYEFSLVPTRGSQDADVLCDKDFDGKLRPIVTEVLNSGNRDLNVTFKVCSESPLAEPGVIRYPHVEDRACAERLHALLSELVGLVNLRVADAEESQLDRVFVWLRYDKNAVFHSFVGHLLESVESGARDDLRGLFTDRGWEQDRATRVEYSPSCVKILPYRADDFDRDWMGRFIRPWTFRLATWRLQREEGMATWYSVVSAQRTLVCMETPVGIRVDAAPEVNDLGLPERFDVVLTGGGEELRAVLSKFDPKIDKVEDGPLPGRVPRTIYFPKDVPGGEAVARMTQAILRDKGLVFDLEPYVSQGDGHVYVVASATKERRDGQP